MKQKLLKILYRFYAFFARVYIKRTKPEIIGITGSVGKTSSRMIIFQILQQHLPDKKVYTSPKNYNSEIGLVMSVFGIENYSPSIKNLVKLLFSLSWKSIFMKKKADILVLEYGVDVPKDMEFLLQIAVPDYAVFTKLDYIHAANFESKDAVGQEKMKLLSAAKKAVFVNFADDFAREYHFENQEKYLYNTEEISAQYDILDGNIVADLQIQGKSIQTNMLGNENFVYIDLAFSILKFFSKDFVLQNKSFIELENQSGRFSILQWKNDSTLIDSSYNAGFESIKKMIENTVALQQQVYLEKKIIFVLGDMREVGEASEQLHKELYDFTKEKGLIISVGKETGAYFGKHLGNFKYARQAGIFLRTFLQQSEDEYIVLFKGSQNTIFLEESIKEVLKYKKDRICLVRQESYWEKEGF